MIQPDEQIVPQRRNAMKKLMTLALGLAFVLGAVPVVFAQDAPKKEEPAKKTPKKGKKAPKKDDATPAPKQ
jgi:hypothetical protein